MIDEPQQDHQAACGNEQRILWEVYQRTSTTRSLNGWASEKQDFMESLLSAWKRLEPAMAPPKRFD